MKSSHSAAFSQEARKTIEKLAEEILEQEKILLDEAKGAEAIHDARVAVNKLRVALNLLPSSLPKKTLSQLQENLKWLKDGLAAVRDTDVILELVRTLGDPPYEQDRPGIEALTQVLEEERATHLTELAALVEQSRFTQLMSELESLRQKSRKNRRKLSADSTDGDLLEQDLSELIQPLRAKFEKRRKALSDSFDSASMHQLRISAKKFRYTLDFFKNLKPDLYPRISQTLRSLHDCTGKLHDIDVLWPKVEQRSARWQMTLSAKEVKRLETGVEWVIYRLYARRRELMREFYGIWAAVASEEFQSRSGTAAGVEFSPAG